MAQRNYVFEAEPRALASTTRAKYRGGNKDRPRETFMSDRRIFRGITHRANIPTMEQTRRAQQDADRLRRKQADRRRKRDARRYQEEQAAYAEAEIPAGRESVPVQTDGYLEELVDKVFEKEVKVQTDEFEDKRAPPIFVPKQMGVSVGTEIASGDLFDFDLAVEPILEVLVGKCMDQSLVEVLEEEELKALRSQREAFIEERNQAIAESQKLEAESQRRFEERERRLEQERDRLVNEQIVAHKIASRQTSAQFLQGLNNQVIDKLSATGHFYDPVQDQVENSFLPWLLESVYSSLKEHELVQQQVDQVITSALSAMTTQLANQDAVQAKAAADQVAAQETFEQEVIAVQSQIDAEAAKKAEYDRLVAERNARVEARAAAEAQRLEELENQSVEEQDEDATDDDTMTENTETDTETDYTDGSYTDTTA